MNSKLPLAVLLGLGISTTAVAVEEEQAWDVATLPGEARTVQINTTSGT
jgi:hypothetical protein